MLVEFFLLATRESTCSLSFDIQISSASCDAKHRPCKEVKRVEL